MAQIQQHQTFYPQPQPVTVPIVQTVPPNPQCANQNEPYPNLSIRKAVKVISIFQIVLGAVCILFQSAILLMTTTRRSYSLVPQYFAAGIWNGAFFVITGIIGLRSAIKKSRGLVVAMMVINIILVSLFVPALLAFTSTSLIFTCYNGNCERRLIAALTSIMLISAIVNFILGIILSAVACSSTCCRSAIRQSYQVGYSAQQAYVNNPAGVGYYQPSHQPVPGSSLTPNAQGIFMTQVAPASPQTSINKQTNQTITGLSPPTYQEKENENP